MNRYVINVIVLLIFAIRLLFLKVSKKNEKQILADGGKEYGVRNSKHMTILHILFYLGCFIEAIIRKAEFDTLSMIGSGLLVFSICMLYVVTRLLEGIWTVKLMIVKNHKFNNHWLFRVVKHPNYFLNIIPELAGLTLLCHGFYTALAVSPFYAIVMYLRVKEENQLIKDVIKPNGIK